MSDTLWAENPVVILTIRRPGCIACRGQAQDLWARRDELAAAGVKLAVVCNQALPAEIEDFKDNFWPGGDMFLDSEKEFYKALGEGQIRKGSLAVRPCGETVDSRPRPHPPHRCPDARTEPPAPVPTPHIAVPTPEPNRPPRTAPQTLLNPFSRAWRNMFRFKHIKKHNMKGDGTILGGLLIVSKGGEVPFAFQEKTFGEAAPVDDIVAAALKA